jgi:hypothetical protein
MPLQFLKSQRGNQQLIYNGFIFRRERISPNKTFWKCVENYKRQNGRELRCKGRCQTSNDEVIYHSDNHNHVPNTTEMKVKRIQHEIKQRAVEVSETPQQILAVSTSTQSNSVKAALPSIPAMKRKIQRARTINDVPFTNPTNLSELFIPDSFKVTDAGQPFLLFDNRNSQPTEPIILIFSTFQNLDMMTNCDHWYADGTFKTTPPLFAQVWTIHGLKYNNVLPTVFALLPNKTQGTHISAHWKQLKCFEMT